MQYQVDVTTLSQENLVFGTLDHPKMLFCDLRMILPDLVVLPNVPKHQILSEYAISSRSNRPKSRKPCFWHFGSFKNAFFWLLNDPKWAILWLKCKHHLVATRICHIRQIEVTKVNKMTWNLVFLFRRKISKTGPVTPCSRQILKKVLKFRF